MYGNRRTRRFLKERDVPDTLNPAILASHLQSERTIQRDQLLEQESGTVQRQSTTQDDESCEGCDCDEDVVQRTTLPITYQKSDCLDCPEDTIQRISLPKIDVDLPKIDLPSIDIDSVIGEVQQFIRGGEEAEQNTQQEIAIENDAATTRLHPAQEQANLEVAETDQTMQGVQQDSEDQIAAKTAAADQYAQQMTAKGDGLGSNIAASANLLVPLVTPTVAVMPPSNVINQADNAIELIGEVTDGGNWGDLTAEVVNTVNEGFAADGEEGWSCDEREIVALATGLPMTALEPVGKVANIMSGGQLENIVKFGNKAGNFLMSTASGVGSMVGRAGSRAINVLDHATQPIRNEIRRMAGHISGMIQGGMNLARRTAGKVIGTLSSEARKAFQFTKRTITSAAKQAGQFAKSLYKKATGVIGGVVGAIKNLLPDWVKDGINQLLSIGSRVVNFAKNALIVIKDRYIEQARQAIGLLRDHIDRQLQLMMVSLRLANDVSKEATKVVDTSVDYAAKAVPQPVKDVAGEARNTAEKGVDTFNAVSHGVYERVEGTVCTEVNKAGQPCLDRYFPYEQGQKVSYEAGLSGVLTVPIPKTPGLNLEAGAGAQLSVTRMSPTTYEVKFVGDGSLGLGTEFGAKGVGAGAETKNTNDPKKKHKDVWSLISGLGSNPNLDIEAELAGRFTGAMEVTHKFEVTDSNCDLALMGALLASYGMTASSLGLPAGLGHILFAGSNLVRGAGFDGYVSSTKLSLGIEGEGNIDINSGDLAEFDGDLLVFMRLYAERFKDESTGEEKLRIGSEVGGELGSEFELLGDMLDVTLLANGELDSSLVLAFINDQIVLEEVRYLLEAEVGGNVAIEALELIDGAPEWFDDILAQAGLKTDALLKLQASLTFANLAPLTERIDRYVFITPIEEVSIVGLVGEILAGIQESEKTLCISAATTTSTGYEFNPEAEIDTGKGFSLGIEGESYIKKSVEKELGTRKFRI